MRFCLLRSPFHGSLHVLRHQDMGWNVRGELQVTCYSRGLAEDKVGPRASNMVAFTTLLVLLFHQGTSYCVTTIQTGVSNVQAVAEQRILFQILLAMTCQGLNKGSHFPGRHPGKLDCFVSVDFEDIDRFLYGGADKTTRQSIYRSPKAGVWVFKDTVEKVFQGGVSVSHAHRASPHRQW